MDFAYALRSFTGYLEGSGKSAHTIKNYRSDLNSFQEFLEKGLGSALVPLSQVNRTDLEQYHDYLKAQGQKTNTRRRKILTVRRLLTFLTKRNKISLDVGKKLPTPHKMERVPLTVKAPELLIAVQNLKIENEIQLRNRVLLWMLAETGAQVSEVARMRFDDLSMNAGSALLQFRGKSERQITVSKALHDAAMALSQSSPYLFLGHNKFGSLGSPITPRGIELLVKSYAPRLGLGELTPRTFRHSIVVQWFSEGLSRDEIQKRLGLKTAYAFRIYEPLFMKTQGTTDVVTGDAPEVRSRN